MRSILMLPLLATVAAAQPPQYDLLLKRGPVIDTRKRFDGTWATPS